MTGTKTLSEAVHMDEIKPATLNMIVAPVGSGKTHWALHELSRKLSLPYKMLYLIDTRNGNNQLVEQNDNTRFYNEEWENFVEYEKWFSENLEDLKSKVAVMTYAKFGALVEKSATFGDNFEIIVCDELHSLPKFCAFQTNNAATNYHKIAQTRLEEIVNRGKVIVVALSATPRRASKLSCPLRNITVDDDVRHFDTAETISYSSLPQLLRKLSPEEKGIVYIGHVRQMIEFQQLAEKMGFRAICIWSDSNKDNPMCPEQMAAKNHIITSEELPPEYDMVIINASCETGINIRGKVDYIAVHRSDEDTRTQVRGRYRGDLGTLYLYQNDADIEIPEEYLNKPLSVAARRELCAAVNIRDKNGTAYGWTTVKKRAVESGYIVYEQRIKNHHYFTISL